MAKGVILKIKTSDGQEWPCRVTLGAMRRYKAETGKDVETICNVEDITVFIWCCVKSACAADKKPFDLSLEDFCDMVDGSIIKDMEGELTGDEKKTPQIAESQNP